MFEALQRKSFCARSCPGMFAYIRFTWLSSASCWSPVYPFMATTSEQTAKFKTQPPCVPWPTVFLHVNPSATRRVGDGAVADASCVRQLTVPICVLQVPRYQQSSVVSMAAIYAAGSRLTSSLLRAASQLQFGLGPIGIHAPPGEGQ